MQIPLGCVDFNFWFHIFNLGKIPFNLIGRTIWFNTNIKFSYFEPLLLFCNGDSKTENLNSLQKYIVWPIKLKGILPRLTKGNQKLSQHTPVESALKIGLFFSDFENYSKSASGKISLSFVLVLYTCEIGKTAKKPRVVLTLDWLSRKQAPNSFFEEFWMPVWVTKD